jgi:hypothetical protein
VEQEVTALCAGEQQGRFAIVMILTLTFDEF